MESNRRTFISRSLAGVAGQHLRVLRDLAFALLINRTSAFYQANPPVYMTYTEHTHVSAPTLGRAQDINRTIAVRVADNSGARLTIGAPRFSLIATPPFAAKAGTAART